MLGFLFALQFLTIIPVKIKDINSRMASSSIFYFPLVGLLLGLILAASNNILTYFCPGFGQFTINTILVVLLTVLTGGLHLDGLADATDAVLSRKNQDEMLRIMRDSHIGAMGVLSLICVILLKISFLCAISIQLKPGALLSMCVISRWALVLAMALFPYARQEGKAKVFMEGVNFKILASATLVALTAAILIWRLKGVLIFGFVGMCVYIIARYFRLKIGGITGDTLGAISEITEVLVLFNIALLSRFN